MAVLHDPTQLPADLPVPKDDGGARHLAGMRLPRLKLPATDGRQVDLSALRGRTVVYIYPRTGKQGQELPTGWDAIPGARGCTPQSCGFRDHFADLRALQASIICSDFRRRTRTTSARPSSACTCRSRSCPTPSLGFRRLWACRPSSWMG